MVKSSGYAIGCLLAASLMTTPAYAGTQRPAGPSYDLMADNGKMETKEEERFKRAEEREKMRHEKREEKIKERHEKREAKIKERQERKQKAGEHAKEHLSGGETAQPSGNPPHVSGNASSEHMSGK